MAPKKAAKKEKPKKAKAAMKHVRAVSLKLGTVLRDNCKNEFVVGKTIGVGGFGDLYSVTHSKGPSIQTGGEYILKVEPLSNGPLFVEVAFYNRVAKSAAIDKWKNDHTLEYVGVPKFISMGTQSLPGDKTTESFRFLVMPRLGKDLDKQFEECGRRFSEKIVFLLAIHVLHSLEYIHAQGYSHGDIKGQNLLMGLEGRAATHHVYLVDFGLAERFVTDGKHRDYKVDPKRSGNGTPEFESRDAHLGVYVSARSDLENLGYCLIQWLTGSLPWDHLTSDDLDKIYQEKEKYLSNISSFLKDCFGSGAKCPAQVKQFLESIISLDYDQKPDYEKLRKLFVDGLKRMKVNSKSEFNFTSANKRESPLKSEERVVKKKKCEKSPVKNVHKIGKEQTGNGPITSKRERDESPKKAESPNKKKQKNAAIPNGIIPGLTGASVLKQRPRSKN